jgi:hypothetical protein
MSRCPTHDCGAKRHPRATYCSQICRRAHESGRSRAAQLRLEAEGRPWSYACWDWESTRPETEEALSC